jgi:hypothetical protein
MLFRRKSKIDRVMETAERFVPPLRMAATAVGVVTGGLALLTAASSGVSTLRQKQS